MGELASRAARSLSAASHRARDLEKRGKGSRKEGAGFFFFLIKANEFHDARKGLVAATDHRRAPRPRPLLERQLQ